MAAILASLAAAGFTGWYAWDTHGMRTDAEKAAKEQREDVKQAREAAQRSARASEQLAEGMDKTSASAEKSAEFAKETVKAMQSIVHAEQGQLAQSREGLKLQQQPRFGEIQEISGELNINTGKPVVITPKVVYSGGGQALNCRFEFNAEFSTDLKALDYPKSLKMPALVDFSTDASVSLNLTVTAGAPHLSTTGNLKLYTYNTITCDPVIKGEQPYEKTWCTYYPVLIDGRVDKDDVRGCSDGNAIKKLEIVRH